MGVSAPAGLRFGAGFFVAKAMPAADLPLWLAEWTARCAAGLDAKTPV
ncbi:hypothetical protein [Chromatium okenii]|nr:hypothetical protein [Chromatium okenii]